MAGVVVHFVGALISLVVVVIGFSALVVIVASAVIDISFVVVEVGRLFLECVFGRISTGVRRVQEVLVVELKLSGRGHRMIKESLD